MTQPTPANEIAPAGADALGLRERKKRQTWQALRAAALRLIAERGLDAVSIDDITAAADVSRRTFFNYFESKEAAVVDFAPEYAPLIRTLLRQRPAGEPPVESLRAIIIDQIAVAAEELAGELQQRWRLIQAFPALSHRQAAAFAAFDRIVSDWVSERLGIDPATSLYPDLFASASSAAVGTALMRWDPATGVPALIGLFDEAYDHLADGLAPPARTALVSDPDRGNFPDRT